MERTIATPQAPKMKATTEELVWPTTLDVFKDFIAGVWRKLRRGFWSAKSRFSADITQPLDIERIAEQLRVVERAEEDARQNLPSSDEGIPAGTKREIIAYFSNLRRRAHKEVADTAEQINKSLEQLRDSDALANLQDIPARCENRIFRYVADAESQLQHVVERERSQKQHYDAFRENNKLNRVATYPEFAYLYYMVVPLLIAAMAYVLAEWLLPDSASAISATWIATVSAAAVVLPFMFGVFALRAINHVDGLTVVAGCIACVVALAAIAGIAYFADFYVAAATANPDVSSTAVFDAIWSAPLAVVSGLDSWTIFTFFALAGLLAMYLGYFSDDTYPGYGAVQRSYYRARSAREAQSLRLRKRINTLVDKAEMDAENVVKEYKAALRTYTSTLHRSKLLPTAMSSYDAELEDACNILLDRYSAANHSARRTATPTTFGEHVCFNAQDASTAAWQTGGGKDVDDVQRTLASLESEAKLAHQKLRALNLRMIGTAADSQTID